MCFWHPRYRTAPNLDAKDEDRIPAKRGDIVQGEVSNGWLRTADEGLYLPLHAPDGRPLLQKKGGFVPWNGGDEDAFGGGGGGGAYGSGGSYGGGGGDFRSTPSGRPPLAAGCRLLRSSAGHAVDSADAARPPVAPMSELEALHQKGDRKYGAPRGVRAAAAATALEQRRASPVIIAIITITMIIIVIMMIMNITVGTHHHVRNSLNK